jgi:hypothetical protein
VEVRPLEPATCVVLDPFAGTGTVAAVAVRHGRAAIACELNPEYAAIIRRRTARESGLFTGHVQPITVEPEPAQLALEVS